MADPEKHANRLAAEAMLGAAKDAARRAIEDLTLTDEERAARELERARAARLRRWKWIAIAALAVVLAIGVIALIAKLWLWLLALAVIAALGFVAYRFVRAKLGAKAESAPAGAVARLAAPRSYEAPAEGRIEADDEARAAAEAAAAREAARAAAIAAREEAARRERQIDEELAALKAKVAESKDRK